MKEALIKKRAELITSREIRQKQIEALKEQVVLHNGAINVIDELLKDAEQSADSQTKTET